MGILFGVRGIVVRLNNRFKFKMKKIHVVLNIVLVFFMFANKPVFADSAAIIDKAYNLTQQKKLASKQFVSDTKLTKSAGFIAGEKFAKAARKKRLARLEKIGLMNNIFKFKSNQVEKGAKPSLFIFVSLSMPKRSIEQAVRDAERFSAVIVLRGLVHNSFKKTVETIQSLIKGRHASIVINPVWFRRFAIDKVPAVVLSNGVDRCTTKVKCHMPFQNFDVVYGNVPLKSALRTIADKGSAHPVEASSLLKSIQVKS